MWNFNGHGWIKEIESDRFSDEGYTHWFIERRQDGKFDLKILRFFSGAQEEFKSSFDSLDEAKIEALSAEDNINIFAIVLMWLAVIGIVSFGVISIGGTQ